MIRMVVASVEDARPRRRAQRSGVHVGVGQPSAASASIFGCGNRAAVTAEVPIAGVVEDDEHDVGESSGAAGPATLASDSSAVRAMTPGERCAGLIFSDCHQKTSSYDAETVQTLVEKTIRRRSVRARSSRSRDCDLCSQCRLPSRNDAERLGKKSGRDDGQMC